MKLCLFLFAAAISCMAPEGRVSENHFENTDSNTITVAEGPFSVKESDMDITASDGHTLRATYYNPGSPGSAMLLLHQCNMDRKSWTDFARELSRRGIHVLSFDYRGYGETSAKGNFYEKLDGDIDIALRFLQEQPGVNKQKIAVGGASCSVENTVQLAKRNGGISALMLLSGPCSPEGLAYIKSHPELPVFGAASAEEEAAEKFVSGTVEASANPNSQMTVIPGEGHGAPMFSSDTSLLSKAVEWVVRVLK